MIKLAKYTILTICLMMGYLNTPGYSQTEPSPSKIQKDPYEKFNRVMFDFNEKLDKYCLKPVAKVYKAVLPKPLKKGIHNIFQNLHSPSTVVNDICQTNFHQAAADSWRFIANTTAGIGGFFDVASKLGVSHHATNFGVTLARWGYTNSNYLVLPFWGPTTIRDSIGLPVDYMMTIYPHLSTITKRNTVGSIEIVNIRAQALRFEDVYETMAMDPYIFVRNAYLQNRTYIIEHSKAMTSKTAERIEQLAENQTPNDQDIYYLEEE